MTRAHLPAIDGLRAVAVLAVVAYHAGLPVPAGFVGVDVFFVISGYVITRLLAAGPIDFLGFYARRARRILPALVVLVVSVLIASAFLLAPDGEQQRLAKSAAASLLFAGNVFFQSTTGGYFDPSTETMPLLHLWSLGVEEQFYLLWPLLLVAARKRLPVLALASFALAEAWLWFNPEAAFYQMPARFWELAVGGMIALYGSRITGGNDERERQESGRGPGYWPRLWWGNLRQRTTGGAAWHGGGPQAVSGADQRGTAVAGGGAEAVGAPLCAGIPAASHGQALTTFGLLLTLAACLLPLPHFPGAGALPAVLGASCVLLAAHNGQRSALLESRPMVAVGLVSYSLYLWHWPALAMLRSMSLEPPTLEARLVAVGIAAVLAVASYRYVEQPFRQMRTAPRRAVAVGVAASLVLATGAFTYSRQAQQWTPASAANEDRPTWAIHCHERSDDAPQVPRCGARVIVWGDSMALAWSPFARALAERQGLSAANVSRDACGPGGAHGGTPRAAERCVEFNRQVMAYVRSGQVDTLLLAWRWNAGPDYLAGLEGIVAEAKRHARVVVIGPTPTLKAPAHDCIARGVDCGMTRAEFDAEAAPIRARLARLGVEVVDPTGYWCDAMRCPVVKAGRPLYWDAYHVSASAAWAFGEAYQPHIE